MENKINTNLKLEKISENEWELVLPKEISEIHEEYLYALETLQISPLEGVVIMKRLADKFPDDHIEAYLALGYYYEKIQNLKRSKESYFKAFKIVESVIPKNFNSKSDKLPWGIVENRQLLRGYFNWALQSMYAGNLKKASGLLNFIINVNPEDNMGARYLLTECCFLQNKLKKIIELYNIYNDDISPEFFYSLGLIYYKKFDFDNASRYLKSGIENFPNVALELLAGSKKFPLKEFLSHNIGVISGGEVEAYEFKEIYKRFWDETDGALNYLYHLLPGIK
ncbi:MAG: hypothetical protein IT280_10465 [Ignavibacteria bacterium]|nr:hypothetical protein [Ignavibacteria bacterium]